MTSSSSDVAMQPAPPAANVSGFERLQPQQPPSPAPSPAAGDAAAGSAAAGGEAKKRVLFAEDDTLGRTVVGRMLERVGASATAVADGAAAVEEYKKGKPVRQAAPPHRLGLGCWLPAV